MCPHRSSAEREKIEPPPNHGRVIGLVVQLVLFDIDGTLIRTGGAGMKAFARTFAEIFDRPEATATLNFSGRTDVSLVREALRASHLEASTRNIDRFFAAYPSFLRELLEILPGGICEGVAPFLQELMALDGRPLVGLLTGNIKQGAELKLRKHGLWERFELGAFADDHEDRDGIAAAAKRRGEEKLGRPLAGSEIVVIGDTPLDVRCAHSIGAKALAVATGIHPLEELAGLRPAWAVRHLGELTLREVIFPPK